ncbi:MAG: hypothetical protein H0V44_05200 [Planctomycetes bacterium]|nr:hypothetical protein [Planctomycetota bacterium]
MARQSSSSQTPKRRSSGGGGGYLFVIILIAGLACTFVFAGDKVRSMLGIAKKPSDEGAEPTAPVAVEGSGAQKVDHQGDMPPSGVTTVKKEAPKPTAPVAKPIEQGPTFKDQAKAEKILAEAEKAYAAFQWQDAKSAAAKLRGLDAKKDILARASDISTGATEIENLFKGLDDRDELTRNYDTDPSLVQIGEGKGAMFVVPVVDDSKPPTIVDQDPLNYIRQKNQAGSKIWALIKGNKDFMLGQLPDTLGDLALVDQKSVRSEKLSEFNAKVATLRNSTRANDALAWYDGAKYAYRNRLDDHVTKMLDRALDLDPDLVKTVREDKAAKLYANMVFHLQNNNRKQADTFITIIRRKFADTDQGKQAQLCYDGKTGELVALAMQEDQRRKDETQRRMQARIEKAKNAGDLEKVAAIEKEQPVEETEEVVISGSPDEAAAEKEFNEGYALYAKANDMPPVAGRNVFYKDAAKHFEKAVAMYRKLVEKNPSDTNLQNKMVRASQLKFGSHKNQTAF